MISEFGAPAVARVVEVEAPHAAAGEVRIAVRASGLSTGEVRIRSGKLADKVPVALPRRTGFDAAGVVDEIGEGVTGLSIGDEVFGMASTQARGANADYVVLSAWARKPSRWSWAEAGGAAASAETATRVLDRLGVRAGQTVLVHGAAAATGSVVVQFAVARGAVVVGTASERNHDFLRSFGVVPTTYGPGLPARVRDLAPQGIDAVVDCAGGALPDLIAVAGDAARVVTIADFDAAAHGVHMSHGAPAGPSGRPVAGGADPLAVHGLADAVRLAESGRLRIPVAATFPLNEVAAAHELSESRHAPGRIVLVN
ncbi:oxidoreductase [Paractinoplanes deccanensis]|uniref:Oxidoreductase n=1 Tax=Paractinoplanes deccanensis TaxID=113561 RepID=A0ABQ3YLZ7_9ACTN|nr:oxidoreductase [Actinoplanes deccanensis]